YAGYGNGSIYNTYNTYYTGGFAANNNTFFAAGSRFVPYNARVGGAVFADPVAFSGRGGFRVASGSEAVGFFSRGQFVGRPAAGRFAAAGPAGIRPSILATTPTRAFRSNVAISRNI